MSNNVVPQEHVEAIKVWLANEWNMEHTYSDEDGQCSWIMGMIVLPYDPTNKEHLPFDITHYPATNESHIETAELMEDEGNPMYLVRAANRDWWDQSCNHNWGTSHYAVWLEIYVDVVDGVVSEHWADLNEEHIDGEDDIGKTNVWLHELGTPQYMQVCKPDSVDGPVFDDSEHNDATTVDNPYTSQYQCHTCEQYVKYGPNSEYPSSIDDPREWRIISLVVDGHTCEICGKPTGYGSTYDGKDHIEQLYIDGEWVEDHRW